MICELDGDQSVGELAARRPGALAVLRQSGIDGCCGGAEKLADACLHAGISLEELSRRLNAAPVPPKVRDWTEAAAGELIAHIVGVHHAYVRAHAPILLRLAAAVHRVHGAHHPELAEMEAAVGRLCDELDAHMDKEERILFPYIERLESAGTEREDWTPPPFGTVRHPIAMMLREHAAAGNEVAELRRLSAEYRLPEDACASYRGLFQELQEFERDLTEHIHLENNILFPRAEKLESALLADLAQEQRR